MGWKNLQSPKNLEVKKEKGKKKKSERERDWSSTREKKEERNE